MGRIGMADPPLSTLAAMVYLTGDVTAAGTRGRNRRHVPSVLLDEAISSLARRRIR